MISSPRTVRTLLVSALSLSLASLSFAQKPVAPELNSNLGARYTLYLDFSGFDYRNVANGSATGQWSTTGRSPGVVPAFTTDGNATAFSGSETQAIRDTWARFANAYVGFNINVTTVDPAAAGLNDAQRQAVYDQTRYLQHQVLGGTYNWYGAAGGVSFVGVAQSANVSSGRHTNWVFPVNGSGTSAKGMAAAGIHEDGHALGLNHQRDETTGADYSDNNGAQGFGSYAPIMGTTYVSQRGTWRQGRAGTNSNDVAVMQSQANMGAFQDDGIGHSLATATQLAINGTGVVNSGLAKGWIMPKASTNYSAGAGGTATTGDATNYTTDLFKFRASGGTISLTANDGTSYLQTGVADPGATMRSVLRILDKNGNLIGTGAESASTLTHTYSGSLVAGDYYAQVLSYGAYISSYESSSRYFNMGGYFLSGSGFAQPVPEPATMIALAGGAAAFLRRRRKSA